MLGFFFLFPANTASGQNDLTDAMVTERLETIHHMLGQGKKGANLWWYGWLAGYSAATVAQTLVMIASDDLDTRQDMALGAATTFLGAAGQIISPMTPGLAPEKLNQLSEQSQEERLAKLLEAENLLKESALREQAGRSWKTHALCGIVNVSSGLVTWFGFDRNIWAGLGNFMLNTAIAEAQIFTQPVRAMKDYDRYMKQYYGGENQKGETAPALNWSLQAYPGGVTFRLVF